MIVETISASLKKLAKGHNTHLKCFNLSGFRCVSPHSYVVIFQMLECVSN